MATNYAGGNDKVPVQVGRVDRNPDASRKAKEQARRARERREEVRGANIRTGDAQVGVQVDRVDGDLTIRW